MEHTIQQFAKLFGVTEHTIRYYTDIGLLPCKRSHGNHRIFDAESFNWMQGIECLKYCGASLEEIQAYCELCKQPDKQENLQARYQIILHQRELAYERLKKAQDAVEYMEKKVQHYEEVLSGAIPDDTNPRNWTQNSRPKLHSQFLQKEKDASIHP